jgi:hypothetical protein
MYVKLFRDMLNSTIWMQDDYVVRVWLVFLLMADQDGLVKIPIPALAMRARTTIDNARDAVRYLESPDPDSQSSEEGGRRILRIDDDDPVWFIVNYEKYKKIRNAEDRRAYMKNYMRDYRAKKKRDESVNSVNSGKPLLAHIETETDIETEIDIEHLSSMSTPEPVDVSVVKKPSVDWWFEDWNTMASNHDLSQVVKITDKRRTAARARLKEHGEAAMIRVIALVPTMPFLLGESESGWMATADSVLRPTQFLKILEGGFAAAASRKPTPNHTTASTGGEWMYDTYLRADLEAHEDEDLWPTYCNAVAGMAPRTAPTFTEWYEEFDGVQQHD